MAASPIFLRTPLERRIAAPNPQGGWRLLLIVGAVFVLIGGLDLALAWFPIGLGNPEWEFGTISATLNGLPLPTIGMMLLLAALLAEGRARAARVGAGALGLLALLLVVLAFLYLTVVPIALGAAPNPYVAAGLRKAVVKGTALLVIYPLLYLSLAVVAWKQSARRP